MKHITVDEMIDFVSFNKLDDGSLALSAEVNAHIFKCDICRKKVEAFQTVYDELVKMKIKEDPGKTIKNVAIKEKKKQFDDFM